MHFLHCPFFSLSSFTYLSWVNLLSWSITPSSFFLSPSPPTIIINPYSLTTIAISFYCCNKPQTPWHHITSWSPCIATNYHSQSFLTSSLKRLNKWHHYSLTPIYVLRRKHHNNNAIVPPPHFTPAYFNNKLSLLEKLSVSAHTQF